MHDRDYLLCDPRFALEAIIRRQVRQDAQIDAAGDDGINDVRIILRDHLDVFATRRATGRSAALRTLIKGDR